MITRKITTFLVLAVLLQAGMTMAALSLVQEFTGNARLLRLRFLEGDIHRAEDFTTYAGFASVSLLIAAAVLVRASIRRSVKRFRVPAPTANGALLVNAEHGDELDEIARIVNDISNNAASTRVRHRVEDDSRMQSEQFTQQVVGAMFDIVIVTDPDLRIVMANRAACEMLGRSKLDLIGSNIEDVFALQRYAFRVPIRQLLMQNEMRDYEMTYRGGAGEVPALVSASILRNSVGSPVAVITVGKDITTRKALERDLLEAKVAAEAANRAKSAFVANMSHEIRTPMTAILGYADLLMRPESTSDQRRNWLETIGRNGRHLISVINDILDVSKIEAGRMTAERIECQTIQLIGDVTALMRGRAVDKGLRFDVRCVSAIPDRIQTDPVRLRQILINLIGNAIKFTAKGAVQVRVNLIERTTTSAALQFSVIDSGIGLSQTQIESLFKPFMQADSSTTRKFGGTGLGLVITRKLVELLGGAIDVRSVAGSGSTFSFAIEIGDISNVRMIEPTSIDQLLPADQTAATAPADVTRLNGRVLLAEDGPDNRDLIGFYLTEAGMTVTMVENGLLAVQNALAAEQNGNPFDAILMDMQMPELDGYSAATSLRQQRYSRPIIALTAHSLEGDRDKCIAAGCDDYAVKPIDRAALIATLAKYVQPGSAAETTQAEAATRSAFAPTAHQAALLARPGSAQLLSRFVQGLPSRVQAIASAVASNNYDDAVRLVHQLKGAAGGYGFPTITDRAKTIEHAIESRQLDLVANEVSAMTSEYDEITRHFASIAA